MRYTLYGFSQQIAVEYGLDHNDLLILRWFIDFKDTNDMVHEVINGEIYYWIKYKKIFEDLPILNIKSKDVIRRRLKKLVDKKILTHYTKKNMGTFSFYGVGQNYLKLISTDWGTTLKSGGTTLKSEGTTQKSEPYDSKVGGGTTQKSEQNINLLKDDSIKDIKEECVKNKFLHESDEMKLSKLLFKKMKDNNDKAKEPNFQKWAENIDKLMRLDKYSADEITKMIEFCQSDHFWKSNILSTKKLREKAGTLIIQMNKDKEKKGNNNPAQTQNYDQRKYDNEFWEEYEKDIQYIK